MYFNQPYWQYVLTAPLEFDTVPHTLQACAVVYTVHVIMLCGCLYAILSPGTSWCALLRCIAQQSNPDCKGLFGWHSCSVRFHGSHIEITRPLLCHLRPVTTKEQLDLINQSTWNKKFSTTVWRQIQDNGLNSSCKKGGMCKQLYTGFRITNQDIVWKVTI